MTTPTFDMNTALKALREGKDIRNMRLSLCYEIIPVIAFDGTNHGTPAQLRRQRVPKQTPSNPRKEKFLGRREELMPWQRLASVIEPHYYKPGNGRRPYPLMTMLRIHCIQHNNGTA